MAQKAIAAGLADAAIERFPADGKTKYAHFLSYVGWDPVSGRRSRRSRRTPRPIASFPDLPGRARRLQPGRRRHGRARRRRRGHGAEGLRGQGRARQDRARRRRRCPPSTASPARSAAPPASSPTSRTRRRRGPATTATSSAGATSRPTRPQNRFAFMLSKRQAEALRARLAAGEKIVAARARRARRWFPRPTTSSCATIPGTDPAAGEVVLTAHLCHESAGANDNASGSAAILEVARALAGRDRAAGRCRAPRARSASSGCPRSPARRPISSATPRSCGASSPASTWTWSAACSRRRRGRSTSRARRRPCRTSSTRSPRPGSTRSSRPRRATPRAAATRTPGSSGRPGSREVVPRRRPRARDGQRPRGLRGGGLPRADGLLPRLARRHDPHPEGPAREPRRDEARPRRLHGRRHRLDARRAARGRGGAPARRDARGRRPDACARRNCVRSCWTTERTRRPSCAKPRLRAPGCFNRWARCGPGWRGAVLSGNDAVTISAHRTSARRSSRSPAQLLRARASRCVLLRPPRGGAGVRPRAPRTHATVGRSPRLRVPEPGGRAPHGVGHPRRR